MREHHVNPIVSLTTLRDVLELHRWLDGVAPSNLLCPVHPQSHEDSSEVDHVVVQQR